MLTIDPAIYFIPPEVVAGFLAYLSMGVVFATLISLYAWREIPREEKAKMFVCIMFVWGPGMVIAVHEIIKKAREDV